MSTTLLEIDTMSASKFSKLFEPTKIGRMEVKNRIVCPPMCTIYGTDDGFSNERLKGFYELRARGGAGLIIVEPVYLMFPEGRLRPGDLAISDDKYIPELGELADVIKKSGAKAAMQIVWAGCGSPIMPVAPSPIPLREDGIVPHELTVEEIDESVEAFGDAAKRIKDAGFDGVEFHFCHGFGGSMFLSSRLNKRTDKYGGDIVARTQFNREVIRRAREKVGDDYPLWCRINGDDLEGDRGQTLEDAKIVAVLMEKEGSDAISVSAHTHQSSDPLADLSMALPRGCWVHLAEGIKKVVDVPVIAVGRINDPVLAEQILKDGKADLIAMGRSLIADPDLPKKTLEGKLDDIRPCIACNQGCFDLNFSHKPITCFMNPAVGRPEDMGIKKAEDSKTVLIVGGGPAGMEAARVTALRGHRVWLVERTEKLGGQLKLAGLPPFKGEMENVTKYYENQLGKLRVKVNLATNCTPEFVKKVNPDVVIVATGAEYVVPKIPGIEEGNVVTSYDVLESRDGVGKNVAVLCTGDCCAAQSFVGCQTAAFLAKEGKKVTVVTPFSDIAPKWGVSTRKYYMLRYGKLGISKLVSVKIRRITADGVIWETKGIEKLLKADTLVVTAPRSERRLIETLKGKVPELYEVGDCTKPGNGLKAIREGFDIAIKI